VSHLGRRLNEAAKLGFKRCIVPATHRPLQDVPDGLEVISARSLSDALKAILGS
jgi:DNA repair protein RadA/Sms